MNDDEELQSGAANPEVEAEAQEAPAGDEAAPEKSEQTEEQQKEQAEAEAEKARRKEERKQASIQKRINELTAEKYASQKLAEQLAEQNARILAVLEGKKEASTPSGEPKREQFEEYEDFLTARAEWRAEQKALAIIEKSRSEQEEKQSKREREQTEKSVEKQFLERRAKAEKEFPDYREVVEDWEPRLPDSVVEMIVQHPDGPMISYHLAKNPSLEKQFQEQPVFMHGILLGQMLATLKRPSTKVSEAPAPGKPVSSGSSGNATEPPSDPEKYYAWAKKHLR
jgi:hypothetical protein